MQMPTLGHLRVSVVAALLGAACAPKPPAAAPAPVRTPEPVVGRVAIELPLPPLTERVATLIERLGSEDAALRRDAAWSLASLETAETAAVEALRSHLDDGVRDVRYAAAWALGHLERRSPDCIRCLTHDTPPVFEFQAVPEYPPPAFTRGIEGTVGLDILIGEDGTVAHAQVRHSIPGLDEAAVACVLDWRFKPARRGDRAVAVLASAPVRFERRGAVNRPQD